MKSLGLLLLRVTAGTLIAGHGSQKLFGWFEGPGWKNTASWVESMNLKPGPAWGTLAGASEFGGGTLIALGLLDPIGPLAVIGAMSVATAKAHWGKPIWASKGGAELPVTNMAIAGALLLAGPGNLSVDALLGTRMPRWTAVPGVVLAGALTYYAITGGLPLPLETQNKLIAMLPADMQAKVRQFLRTETTENSEATRAPITEVEREHPQIAGTL